MSALVAWGTPETARPAPRFPRGRRWPMIPGAAEPGVEPEAGASSSAVSAFAMLPLGSPARFAPASISPARSVPTVRAIEVPDVAVDLPRLRLTARGRLLRTLIVFGVLSLVALMRWLPPAAEDSWEADHHVVVRAGQTLTQVAQQEFPHLPVREAMARLQVANKLTAPEVYVGQSLAVPVVR